ARGGDRRRPAQGAEQAPGDRRLRPQGGPRRDGRPGRGGEGDPRRLPAGADGCRRPRGRHPGDRRRARRQPGRPDHGRAAQTPRRQVRRQAGQRADQETLSLGVLAAIMNRSTRDDWPDLSYAAGRDTWTTLHLWSQVIGKIRLVQTPWTNHSWHVPLYVG